MDTSTFSPNAAIDLSLRTVVATARRQQPTCTPLDSLRFPVKNEDTVSSVVRPIPRPPWTIMWYQSLWAQNHKVDHHQHGRTLSQIPSSLNKNPPQDSEITKRAFRESSTSGLSTPNFHQDYQSDNNTLTNLQGSGRTSPQPNQNDTGADILDVDNYSGLGGSQGAVIVDIACCDGPVTFERVSNPNFALTVEHNELTSTEEQDSMVKESQRHLSLKTYVCIYCNQSFKSLFCYQKHKKRHLNPVSVDITATQATYNRCNNERKTKTKDLNVQFFPCKKCGCKFPSYYFVHKHRKVCH